MRKCPTTGKTVFRDEIAAKLAISKIQNQGQVRRFTPKRAYKCPDCHRWHLTSKEKRGGKTSTKPFDWGHGDTYGSRAA